MAALLIFNLSVSSRAAEAPTSIPARDLQADYAILKRALEELHPGLYRYNSKGQMAAHLKALAADLDCDLTLPQAYLAFSTFLAKIRCGHTYPNFFNQPKSVAEALFKGQNRVPFYFRWVDRRMIITRNFSPDENLRPGTEVLAINGVPARTILARLMTVARADGSNDAKRLSNLQVQGESDYEAFDIYFPLFFPPPGGPLKLRIRPPFSRQSMVVGVAPLTYEQRLAPIKAEVAARRGGDRPLWEFKFFDGRTAYLRMPTRAVYNSRWDWRGFLDDVFDQLARREAANLVIDLRGNEGGVNVGDVILSRLIKRDLRREEFRRLVRYRRVSRELVPYLDTWDQSFEDWGDAAMDFGNGFYTLNRGKEDAGASVIKASGRPFAGRTFVLIDSSNSPATFAFAQALRQNRLATLVAQPTGGNQRGINGGAFFLRLPHSKIAIDLPLIGFYPPGERADAGLRPDILVAPRVADVARGIDAELTALKSRLRQGARNH